jgi:hypothetical protein
LGLGSCAIGFGNSDLFVEAIGGEYYRMSSVGEFALGVIDEP